MYLESTSDNCDTHHILCEAINNQVHSKHQVPFETSIASSVQL